ncbi:MAG: transposase [Armatimonadetes bacterium]|nr:transposase [Armatimonadota bacterium]
MPRPPRQSAAGTIYHVLNRGNGQATVFHDDGDYAAFAASVGDACERRPVGVLAWCLMPNHFHLVLQPALDGALSPFMQWLMTAHVRRYHRRHGGGGHVWQGRYRSFPVQADDHLTTVLRYVERNPLRAGLVARAEGWPWSSLRCCDDVRRPTWMADSPVARGRDWLEFVNAAQTDGELEALRGALARGRPYGQRDWQVAAAERLGLESTLRSRGRPRKAVEK